MFRFSLVLAVLAGGCSSPAADDAESITVGLLLPFTGTDSATSSNFERAVLYARDRINEGGGPKGRHIRIVSADTHSDVARAKQSAEALIAAGALVVIGPESAEIAAEIKPILDQHQVIFLSPVVGAADDHDVDCTTAWFRLAPSSRALGEALAKQVIAASLKSAAVLHSDGAYDQALRQAFENRFVALGGSVAFEGTLFRDAQSYSDTIGAALTPPKVDAILLSTSPRSGALFVNELAVYNPRPKLFLSPLLKTDLLLQNAAPEALEGAMGVAPKIFDTSDKFPQAFGARWLGDQPLKGAFFYYDALAMIAFALERSDLSDGRFEADRVRAAIFAGTGPFGESAQWDEIASSLPRIRVGKDDYYTGLTGPILLQPCGGRRSGASSNWQIHAGAITLISP